MNPEDRGYTNLLVGQACRFHHGRSIGRIIIWVVKTEIFGEDLSHITTVYLGFKLEPLQREERV
jgi:hypothetical protein